MTPDEIAELTARHLEEQQRRICSMTDAALEAFWRCTLSRNKRIAEDEFSRRTGQPAATIRERLEKAAADARPAPPLAGTIGTLSQPRHKL